MEGISSIRRSEDGSSQVRDSANRLASEGNDFVFAEQARVAPLDAEDVPAAVDGREHGGPNDGVESGRVSAPGRDGNAHVEKRLHGLRCEQMDDLARLRVTSDLRLLKDRLAVASDFESPAAGWDHLDLGGREPLTNRGRQTDGPGLVVSYRAVLDRYSHRRLE